MKLSFLVILFSAITISISDSSVIDTLYEARYVLEFQPQKNSKVKEKETSILLMNEKESYLKSMAHYVRDSLEKTSKLRKTGNMNVDIENYMKYESHFSYNIYSRIGSLKIQDNSVTYSESPKFNWVVSKETKVINGVQCFKATTSMWGRNWVAYFSPKHPLPFGPYKFNGLPGLIFAVADDKNEFEFKLYKYGKKVLDDYEMEFDTKVVTKKDFLLVMKKEDEKGRMGDGINLTKMSLKDKNEMLKRINFNMNNINHLELTE